MSVSCNVQGTARNWSYETWICCAFLRRESSVSEENLLFSYQTVHKRSCRHSRNAPNSCGSVGPNSWSKHCLYIVSINNCHRIIVKTKQRPRSTNSNDIEYAAKSVSETETTGAATSSWGCSTAKCDTFKTVDYII